MASGNRPQVRVTGYDPITAEVWWQGEWVEASVQEPIGFIEVDAWADPSMPFLGEYPW